MRRRVVILAAVVAVAGGAAVAARAVMEPDELGYRPDVVVQIGVARLDQAIGFYTKVLGFTVTERRDDLKFAHVQSNLPGLEIGVNEVAAPKGSGSTVINIGVQHVGRARATLEARGVVFRGATQVIPGKVALATFSDPDGNVLRLAGPPDTAATR